MARKVHKKGGKVKVVFRDERGRFMPHAKRFDKHIAMVQAVRNGYYTILAERGLGARDLAQVLSQREFESLGEATVPVKLFTSGKKYRAWDIAEQIDKTKKIRRQDLKFTVMIDDGGRKKAFTFYHQIKRNSKSSYQLFRRINQEIGLEGMFLYDRVGGKIMSDRTGKQVKLLGIQVEKIL